MLFFMDKTFQRDCAMEHGQPGRFGAERAKARAFKAALGTRMVAGEKPPGARQR
jgi:hypothetical protein